MSSKIELLKIRDFGEIITDTFGFIRENFKPLIKCFFIFCGFFLVGAAVFSALEQVKAVHAINNFRVDAPNSFLGKNSNYPFSMFGIEYLMIFVFYLLSFAATHVTILSYMCLYKEKGNIPPEPYEVWGYFKYYFLKVFFSGILLIILLCVASVFCLVPFFYLAPIFSIIFPIMIIENSSFGYAFNKSFKLVHKNFWTTFGATFIMVVIVYVAALVIIMPISALNLSSMFLHFGKGTPMSLTVAIISGIVEQLSTILYILPIITACLCYYSLAEETEGAGLLGRISQLGNVTPENNLPEEEY
jgi:hypothetical protein